MYSCDACRSPRNPHRTPTKVSLKRACARFLNQPRGGRRLLSTKSGTNTGPTKEGIYPKTRPPGKHMTFYFLRERRVVCRYRSLGKVPASAERFFYRLVVRERNVKIIFRIMSVLLALIRRHSPLFCVFAERRVPVVKAVATGERRDTWCAQA